MRGVAAIFIVKFHTFSMLGNQFNQEDYLAVDLFFCLSGFVLAHAYERKLESGMSVRQFMVIRIIRLYPLYILGAALGVLFEVHHVVFHADASSNFASLLWVAIPSAFMLPAMAGSDMNMLYPLNPPAWSLFFELLVNIFFAVLVVRNAASNRCLLAIAAVSTVALIALSMGPRPQPVWPFPLNYGWRWGIFLGGIPRVSYSFFMGMLLSRLWRSRHRHENAASVGTLGSIVILIALALSLSVYPGEKWHAVYDRTIVTFLYPALVYFGASAVIGRGLQTIFAFLGTISYALYITHFQIIALTRIFLAHLGHFDAGASRWALTVILIPCCCMVAALLSEFYDSPARRLASRFAESSTAIEKSKSL
jgi:peptidoglycan/LPS O-acetylase OafA/YrhL